MLVGPTAIAPLGLEAAGVEREVADGAISYVWWRLPHLPALLMFVAARAYLQGIGRPVVMFVAVVVANIANFGLDILFVFGAGPIPAMGPKGTALATAICGWLQLFILFFDFDQRPAGSSRAFQWKALAQAASVGLPIGLQMAAEVGVFALAGVLAGRMGAASAAAHQVAITWASLTFCLRARRRLGCSSQSGVGDRGQRHAGCAARGPGVDGGRRRRDVALGDVVSADSLGARASADESGRRAGGGDRPVRGDRGVSGLRRHSSRRRRGAGAARATPRSASGRTVIGHYCVGLPVALLLGLRLGMGVVGVWWGLCLGLVAVALALLLRFRRITRHRVQAL